MSELTYRPDVRHDLSRREREVLEVLYLQTLARGRASVRMSLAQLQWGCCSTGKDLRQEVLDGLVAKRAIIMRAPKVASGVKVIYRFWLLPLEQSLVKTLHTPAEWQRWDEEVESLNSACQVPLDLVTEQTPLAELSADVAAQSKVSAGRMSGPDWLSALRDAVEHPEAYPENREVLPKIGRSAPENREVGRATAKTAEKTQQIAPPDVREVASIQERSGRNVLIVERSTNKDVNVAPENREVWQAVREFVGEHDFRKYWEREAPRLDPNCDVLKEALDCILRKMKLGERPRGTKGAWLFGQFKAMAGGVLR